MDKKAINQERPYRGPVQAIILDWAGTAVDHGSCGPVAVFDRAFRRFGIEPTAEEIRKPMGKNKRDHVREMLAMPRISGEWQKSQGSLPDEAATDLVFEMVQKLMPETLADFAEPVPGCVSAIGRLRDNNVRIGSCTGYSRNMMEHLIPRAAAAGFSPDSLVTADEVPQGRPWPWMSWRNCMNLEVFPPQAVVKLGDTAADIKEGINAGHWSAGVASTGNFMGCSADEAASLPEAERKKREREAAAALREAGAHFVIASIADLPALCEYIDSLLARGLAPGDLKDDDDWNFVDRAFPG